MGNISDFLNTNATGSSGSTTTYSGTSTDSITTTLSIAGDIERGDIIVVNSDSGTMGKGPKIPAFYDGHDVYPNQSAGSPASDLAQLKNVGNFESSLQATFSSMFKFGEFSDGTILYGARQGDSDDILYTVSSTGDYLNYTAASDRNSGSNVGNVFIDKIRQEVVNVQNSGANSVQIRRFNKSLDITETVNLTLGSDDNYPMYNDTAFVADNTDSYTLIWKKPDTSDIRYCVIDKANLTITTAMTSALGVGTGSRNINNWTRFIDVPGGKMNCFLIQYSSARYFYTMFVNDTTGVPIIEQKGSANQLYMSSQVISNSTSDDEFTRQNDSCTRTYESSIIEGDEFFMFYDFNDTYWHRIRYVDNSTAPTWDHFSYTYGATSQCIYEDRENNHIHIIYQDSSSYHRQIIIDKTTGTWLNDDATQHYIEDNQTGPGSSWGPVLPISNDRLVRFKYHGYSQANVMLLKFNSDRTLRLEQTSELGVYHEFIGAAAFKDTIVMLNRNTSSNYWLSTTIDINNWVVSSSQVVSDTTLASANTYAPMVFKVDETTIKAVGKLSSSGYYMKEFSVRGCQMLMIGAATEDASGGKVNVLVQGWAEISDTYDGLFAAVDHTADGGNKALILGTNIKLGE